MTYLNEFCFQVYPYIAVAMLLIGSWARFDKDAYSWRSGSSQLLSNRGIRVGSNLFHVGVLAILGGHLVGLLAPHALYAPFISSSSKQLLAMLVGGFFGILCFIGLSILIIRRMSDPRIRATSAARDIVILWLLWAQLVLGMISIVVSAGHMDGAQMVKLAEWAQHIVTFRWGAADYIADAHWVYKAHVFLGLTLLLVAPFTRLVHIWSIPVSYLKRPYQVVRRRQATLHYGVDR